MAYLDHKNKAFPEISVQTIAKKPETVLKVPLALFF